MKKYHMKKYYILTLGGVIGNETATPHDTRKNAKAYIKMLSRELKIGRSMFKIVALDEYYEHDKKLLNMAETFTMKYARKALKQRGQYKYLYNDHCIVMNTDHKPYMYDKNDKEIQEMLENAPCGFYILSLKEPCNDTEALTALVDKIATIREESRK